MDEKESALCRRKFLGSAVAVGARSAPTTKRRRSRFYSANDLQALRLKMRHCKLFAAEIRILSGRGSAWLERLVRDCK
jgi:hypothetical protein